MPEFAGGCSLVKPSHIGSIAHHSSTSWRSACSSNLSAHAHTHTHTHVAHLVDYSRVHEE